MSRSVRYRYIRAHIQAQLASIAKLTKQLHGLADKGFSDEAMLDRLNKQKQALEQERKNLEEALNANR